MSQLSCVSTRVLCYIRIDSLSHPSVPITVLTYIIPLILFSQIKQLEGQLTGVEEEKAFMESLIAKFADEKDELAAKVCVC